MSATNPRLRELIVFTRPRDFFDDAVVAAIAARWHLYTVEIAYVPEGFGSYHWRVDTDHGRRFVTADDLRARPLHGLVAALATARALRDRGMTFVIAPERSAAGEVVEVVGDYALAVYPFVSGETHSWGPYRTGDERRAVLDLVAALHAAPHGPALVDDFEIPHLSAVTDVPAGTWDTGPFGEPARKLFERHASSVFTRLARYDELATVAAQPARYVLTHGEPHQANTIDTDDGVVLIDWDTALVAPPERDLWALAGESPQSIDDYEARTGTTLRVDACECYRLRWDLSEIAIFLRLFQSPHEEDADTTKAWNKLDECLKA